MLHTLFLILEVFIGGWLWISPMLWTYWTFKPHERPANPESRIAYLIFLGALFGFAGFFAGGFYSALSFIPRSWGALDEDGEFVRTRYSLAILLGVLASFFTLWLLSRVENLVEENQSLRPKKRSRSLIPRAHQSMEEQLAILERERSEIALRLQTIDKIVLELRKKDYVRYIQDIAARLKTKIPDADRAVLRDILTDLRYEVASINSSLTEQEDLPFT